MNEKWPRRLLGELLEVQNGFAFDSKKFAPSGGMPLIRIRDLKSGVGTQTNFLGDYREEFVVRRGDLLIGMDGDFGCYEWRGEAALLNQRVCRLRNFSAKLLPRFLYYGLDSHLKAIEDATTFTTVKHLSSKQIRSIDFPVPPLPEQERIVRFLDEALPLVDAVKAHAATSKGLARDMFLVRRDELLRNDDQALNFGPLNDYCEGILTGPFGSTLHKSDYSVDGVPLINPANIEDGDLVADPRKCVAPEKALQMGRYRVRVGDVLVGRRGEIGRCGVVRDAQQGWLCGTGCFIVRPGPSLDPDYLAHMLRSSRCRNLLASAAGGTTMANLGNRDLAELIVHIPAVDRQVKTVRDLQRLDRESEALVDLAQEKIRLGEDLRVAVLDNAFGRGV